MAKASKKENEKVNSKRVFTSTTYSTWSHLLIPFYHHPKLGPTSTFNLHEWCSFRFKKVRTIFSNIHHHK